MAIVKGKTKENAERLLGAAEGLGLDPSVVRITVEGFEVPDEVLEALKGIEEEKPAAKSKASSAKKKKEGEN